MDKNKTPCPYCDGDRLCPECLIAKKRKKVSEFLGCEVLCLGQIDQPLVTDMQNCIRFQADEMADAARGIKFILDRMRYDKQFGALFHLTESFAQLTSAYASLTGKDVDDVRNSVFADSASAFKNEEVEA